MKNQISKSIIPLLAILLALTAAITTNASIHSNGFRTALVQGYIKNNPLGTNCLESIMCSNVVSNICTVNGQPGGIQCWGKNASGQCILEVYKIP